MPLSDAEREQVSLLRRHAAAAAGLAQAVADAASPLALSQALPVAVQSFGVCLQALRALAATTQVAELDTGTVSCEQRSEASCCAGVCVCAQGLRGRGALSALVGVHSGGGARRRRCVLGGTRQSSLLHT